jgi:cytochrome c oxidase subunit 2
VVVDVTAYQWNWKFGYRTVDAGDGSAPYNGIDEVAQAAVQPEEHAAAEGDEHESAGPIHGLPTEDLSYLNYNKIETLGSSEEIPVLVLPTN